MRRRNGPPATPASARPEPGRHCSAASAFAPPGSNSVATPSLRRPRAFAAGPSSRGVPSSSLNEILTSIAGLTFDITRQRPIAELWRVWHLLRAVSCCPAPLARSMTSISGGSHTPSAESVPEVSPRAAPDEPPRGPARRMIGRLPRKMQHRSRLPPPSPPRRPTRLSPLARCCAKGTARRFFRRPV